MITKISDAEGVLCMSHTDIERAFLTYYQNLFWSKRLEGVDTCLASMSRRITRDMNEQLLQPCTLEEVSNTLQHMGPFKAPGPDGFLACFYQENWSNIGDEVCHVVTHFLISG